MGVAEEIANTNDKGKWIALVSGLDLSSVDVQPGEEDAADIRLQMLVEYLKGESGVAEEQAASLECGALVILGNSLDVPRRTADDAKNSVSRRLLFISAVMLLFDIDIGIF